MTTLETLRRARALIADPEHWTQLEFARDKHDGFIDPEKPGAVKWCAIGAICRFTPPGDYVVFDAAAQALSHGMIGQSIGQYNDTHSHSEVLALFDDAIARLEEFEAGAPLEEVQDEVAEAEPSGGVTPEPAFAASEA